MTDYIQERRITNEINEAHKNKPCSTKRIPYDASEAEQGMIQYLQSELNLAMMKEYKITTQDVISFALIRYYELVTESETYEAVMPYPFNVEDTRLQRFLG